MCAKMRCWTALRTGSTCSAALVVFAATANGTATPAFTAELASDEASAATEALLVSVAEEGRRAKVGVGGLFIKDCVVLVTTSSTLPSSPNEKIVRTSECAVFVVVVAE